MKRSKRVMSYFGHVIWKFEIGYGIAAGDGTDIYFSTIESAMKYIEEIEGIEPMTCRT